MNKETLNKLKELAQAATPGPWRLHHQPGEKYTPTLTDAGHYDEDYFAVAAGIDGDGETVVICDNGQYYSVKVSEYDCRFIAAANPVAVLELIALAERTTSPVSQMTAHLAAIEEALKVMRDNGLDECYAFENAIEALAFMKEVAK